MQLYLHTKDQLNSTHHENKQLKTKIIILNVNPFLKEPTRPPAQTKPSLQKPRVNQNRVFADATVQNQRRTDENQENGQIHRYIGIKCSNQRPSLVMQGLIANEPILE